MAGLRAEDVDLTDQSVRVLGKGSRIRVVPFGARTARAVGRYLRVRGSPAHVGSPLLWLAEKNRGVLDYNGVIQLLRRRGRQVGMVNLHARQFRDTAAHRWGFYGGSETDLMRPMGWRSPQMLRRCFAGTPPALPMRERGRRTVEWRWVISLSACKSFAEKSAR